MAVAGSRGLSALTLIVTLIVTIIVTLIVTLTVTLTCFSFDSRL
jgi:hypothetical protein